VQLGQLQGVRVEHSHGTGTEGLAASQSAPFSSCAPHAATFASTYRSTVSTAASRGVKMLHTRAQAAPGVPAQGGRKLVVAKARGEVGYSRCSVLGLQGQLQARGVEPLPTTLLRSRADWASSHAAAKSWAAGQPAGACLHDAATMMSKRGGATRRLRAAQCTSARRGPNQPGGPRFLPP
jgi:hypothetical protein